VSEQYTTEGAKPRTAWALEGRREPPPAPPRTE